MRWVKLTLPWPVRLRYPLITWRLISSNLAGTLRKLVAVGTSRLLAMLLAMARPAPRINLPGSGWAAGAGEVAGPAAGAGEAAGPAGVVTAGAAAAAGAGGAPATMC